MRRVINAAGPVTPLGACRVDEPVIAAVAESLRHPADIAELERDASELIARAFGCEAGAIVGCTAAAIAMASAACMTGSDLAKVEQLPDTRGMNDRVVLLRGHDCWFGARVGQMVRLSGARIDYVGTPDGASLLELEAALQPGVAAALFVASHHVPERGMVDLAAFARACAAARVPLVVDAAGTVDPRPYLEAGAALVLVSAHKNFGAPTAGIVAGKKDRVEACLLQERGIGRAMKVGKEGIAGAIAGLRQWLARPQSAREAEWKAGAERMAKLLHGVPGLAVGLETDPPEDRIVRTRVAVDASRAGTTARALAEKLRAFDPPVRVWETGLEQGFFAIDPRCLSEDELELVCRSIRLALGATRTT